MTATTVYLDTSAAMKYVAIEAESQIIRAALDGLPSWVSSRILDVELSCAAQRKGLPAGRVAWVMSQVDALDLTAAIIARAADPFDPPQRAFDAIHLATALSLPDPPTFVSYDARQLDAARAAGLACLTPV